MQQSLRRLDVIAPFVDAVVQFAVRSHGQAVHVVTDEGDAHAVAGVQRVLHAGNAIALPILPTPLARSTAKFVLWLCPPVG
jgi:hypothetical protein